MRHDFIDRYSRLDSPIHRLPAGVKLAAALGTVTITALLPWAPGAPWARSPCSCR